MIMIKITATNSTYTKGGVSCSKDSFLVNQTLVFQIKFCGNFMETPKQILRKQVADFKN